MKKLIFCSLASAGLFASPEQVAINPHSYMHTPELKLEEPSFTKSGFLYVRFSAANGQDLADVDDTHPGLGIGYRGQAGNGAVDVSISGIGYSEHSDREYFWSAPKASYIHYLQPHDSSSLYLGGGLAWGGIHKNKDKFIGIIPNVVFGFEFFHKSSILGFVEVTLSQPALPVEQRGDVSGLIGELSIGTGF